MNKPLLIGQAPGPNTDPDRPLAPLPRSSAGGRLAELAGLSPKDYLKTFDRTNLLHTFPGRWKRDDKWPARDAGIAAAAMKPLLWAVGTSSSLGGTSQRLSAIRPSTWTSTSGLRMIAGASRSPWFRTPRGATIGTGSLGKRTPPGPSGKKLYNGSPSAVQRLLAFGRGPEKV